jgi:hypothetical protein
MSKMGSHCPFEHLKHKLWPKERSGVKLAVWLPTTKSQESTQFPCVQAVCNIPLEIFWQGLKNFFRPHHNQRFAREVMCPQMESQLWEFQDSHLGVLRQNAIWMWPPWRGAEYTIRGKVVVSPKSEAWWILWVWGHSWLVLAPKVLQLCTNHLVLVLCRFVWVIEVC